MPISLVVLSSEIGEKPHLSIWLKEGEVHLGYWPDHSLKGWISCLDHVISVLKSLPYSEWIESEVLDYGQEWVTLQSFDSSWGLLSEKISLSSIWN